MGWFSDIYQSVDNFLGGNYSAPEYSQAIGPTQPAAPPQTNYALGAGNGNSGSSGGSGLNLNQLLGAGALGAGTNALGAYLASNCIATRFRRHSKFSRCTGLGVIRSCPQGCSKLCDWLGRQYLSTAISKSSAEPDKPIQQAAAAVISWPKRSNQHWKPRCSDWRKHRQQYNRCGKCCWRSNHFCSGQHFATCPIASAL